MVAEGLTTLYRPVGSAELKLIEAAGFRAFPPRLPEQPIFYPVANETYATQIARDWNTRDGEVGHVTAFRVKKSYLDQFEKKVVGGREHEEFWVPAEELDTFNKNIVGRIDVIATFTERDRLEAAPPATAKLRNDTNLETN